MGTLVELARRLRPLIVRAAQNLEDHEAAAAPQLYEAWMADAAYDFPCHVCVIRQTIADRIILGLIR